ncbi:hypothetical protein TNCV_1329621 [Trichonephila clavipes]|nr:hypothetical protein TNCV_1329621 [Trichonephila clavipes]
MVRTRGWDIADSRSGSTEVRGCCSLNLSSSKFSRWCGNQERGVSKLRCRESHLRCVGKFDLAAVEVCLDPRTILGSSRLKPDIFTANYLRQTIHFQLTI